MVKKNKRNDIETVNKRRCGVFTWLMLGRPLVFFFEVVSSPHRDENLLFRLLEDRDRA